MGGPRREAAAPGGAPPSSANDAPSRITLDDAGWISLGDVWPISFADAEAISLGDATPISYPVA